VRKAGRRRPFSIKIQESLVLGIKFGLAKTIK